MSIEYEGRKMSLACEDCGTVQDKAYDRDDFHIMIQDAKDDGWRVRSRPARAGGLEWQHFCGDCK
jgi:hypothetical protein